MKRVLAAITTAAVFGACTAEVPPLTIADLELTAPLPGTAVGAGYFSLTNNSDTAITISRITSAEFESVEMHEITIDDGMSRMREITELPVAPGETVVFERGGRHLMLAWPAGSVETATLSFFSGESLVLTAGVRIGKVDD